jgi:hypothetical protein
VFPPLAERLWSGAVCVLATGCWEWQRYRSKGGYGMLLQDGQAERAHRVAWFLTYGPIPKDGAVCHLCDNPPCINPAHLILKDRRWNNHDRSMKGRDARPRAKINYVIANEIRARFAAGGVLQSALAREYGINAPAISNIIAGRRWK